MVIKKNRGFSMFEAVVSIAIATVVVFGFTHLNYQNIRISQSNILNLQANLYAMEAMEIAKDLEISEWSQFGVCQNIPSCYPELQSGEWKFLTGEELLNGRFTRSMRVEDVMRDTCDFPNKIVSSGGVVCPSADNSDTKRVTASILWNDSLGDHEINIETLVYATN